VDGNEYIDFNAGIACLNVGHSHPKVVDAIKKQADKFLHYSITDFYYENIVSLGEKLQSITPGNFRKKIFFSNSGAESIETAIKLTRWHTRRPLFLAFIGAFHGRLTGSLSLTASKPSQKKYFSPLMPGVTHVPYPYCYRCPFKLEYSDCDYWCVEFIEKWILERSVPAQDTAAIFFEPIQGEGGYVVPPPDYFQRLKKLADKHEILLVDDEIQAGMGRTGKWSAIEHWNIEPDVTCMAKSLAAGLPIGATIAREDIMDWEGGSHTSTFGGNPVSAAAANAAIDAIKDEKLMENATRLGAHMMSRLKEWQTKYEIVGDVRGKGLMIGIEIVKDKTSKNPGNEESKEIMHKAWRRGVAVITCGQSTIRIAPPLTITTELVDSALEILEGAIKEVSTA
jgi:4-aminobutyrate aminotransferase